MMDPMRDSCIPSIRGHARRGASVAVGLAAVACLMSCAASTSGSIGSSAGGGTAPPSGFASIAVLDNALAAKGIDCPLSYQGLRDDVSNQEVSICTIDGEQAYLRIRFAPDKLASFLASSDGRSGTVAVGANWTVTVSSRQVAAKVATALGGSAPG